MNDRYYIEINDQFFKRGKNPPFDSYWVKRKSEASRFCKRTADRYVRDWKQDGAKKVKVGTQ